MFAVGSQYVNTYCIELNGYYTDDEAEMTTDDMGGVFRTRERDEKVLVGKLNKQDNSGDIGVHGRIILN
jgi:hypothetical protein